MSEEEKGALERGVEARKAALKAQVPGILAKMMRCKHPTCNVLARCALVERVPVGVGEKECVLTKGEQLAAAVVLAGVRG